MPYAIPLVSFTLSLFNEQETSMLMINVPALLSAHNHLVVHVEVGRTIRLGVLTSCIVSCPPEASKRTSLMRTRCCILPTFKFSFLGICRWGDSGTSFVK